MYEQARAINFTDIRPLRKMNERFRRPILPAFVSDSWPCLKKIEIRGVQRSNGQGREGTLLVELRAALVGYVKIVKILLSSLEDLSPLEDSGIRTI